MSGTSSVLEGKEIILGITGSVAAVEDVRLAHALRRRGASVRAVMTGAACGIVHPDAITYATGEETITRCTGLVEHVTYCGDGGSADLLLIAPATANTLCKIAHGIDDTPVTTFATTALGSGMPVVIVPAMHESMYRHPGVVRCLSILAEWGITIIEPRIEEGKAKIADLAEIVIEAERALSGRPLEGRRVLITSGPCREEVDDVRVLTTRSSGRMGEELALQAYRLGAEVTVVHSGHIPCVRNIHAESAADMREAVHRVCRESPVDYYISAAAISDFVPRRHEGKIPSGESVILELVPQPKILREILEAEYRPASVIAFKLGWDSETAARTLLDQGVDLVAANTPDTLGSPSGRYVLIGRDARRGIEGNKDTIAAGIWDALL
jgi:phosphopantothenoylcysteine decarboxylase/phosphopantothenate--cysteine ligase